MLCCLLECKQTRLVHSIQHDATWHETIWCEVKCADIMPCVAWHDMRLYDVDTVWYETCIDIRRYLTLYPTNGLPTYLALYIVIFFYIILSCHILHYITFNLSWSYHLFDAAALGRDCTRDSEDKLWELRHRASLSVTRGALAVPPLAMSMLHVQNDSCFPTTKLKDGISWSNGYEIKSCSCEMTLVALCGWPLPGMLGKRRTWNETALLTPWEIWGVFNCPEIMFSKNTFAKLHLNALLQKCLKRHNHLEFVPQTCVHGLETLKETAAKGCEHLQAPRRQAEISQSGLTIAIQPWQDACSSP